MFFKRFILLITLTYSGKAHQLDTGIIFNNHQEPVQFAIIVNERANTWSTSDGSGIFWIPEETIIGDTLSVERIGFQRKTVDYIGRFQEVFLIQDPIHFPEITVQKKSIFENRNLNKGMTRSEFLNGLPGSVLRSYGGSAGIAQAAIDGGRAADLKVLFNGIDLTSPQNAVTDLSQIPFQYLGYGTLIQNNQLQFGSGSGDGAIQLNPWSLPTGAQTHIGLDGSSSIFAHYGLENRTSTVKVTAGRNNDPGTYPVQYKSNYYERDNQVFEQQFSGIQIESRTGNWLVDASAWYSLNERGINGLIWSPNNEAFRNDTLSLFTVSIVRLFPKGFFRSSISQRESGENYVDPLLAIDSDHFVNSSTYNFSGLYMPNSITKLRLHSGVGKEQVLSTDAGDHARNFLYFAPSVSFAYSTDLTFFTALRLDHYTDFGSAFTYFSKVSQNIFSFLSISGDIGTSFRAPTFNDLYWSPGGNPNLHPEQSTNSRISINLDFAKSSYDLFYKKSASNNLIVWIPIGDSWQPENVERNIRDIFGLKWNLDMSYPISIQGSILKVHSKNLATNRQLRYAPNWIGTIQCRIQKGAWISNLSFHLTGEQIVMYDYPSNLILEPTIMSYFSLEAPPIYNNRIRLKLHISNLLNREIMTIYGYPEAAINARMKISYQINKKGKR